MYRQQVKKAEDNMLEQSAEKFAIALKHQVSALIIDGVEGDNGHGCNQVLEAHTAEEQGEQRRSERF